MFLKVEFLFTVLPAKRDSDIMFCFLISYFRDKFHIFHN